MLETERLILRRWEESDAESLYQYAKDPDVGPIAGWPPHQSIEESLDVIRNVFNGQESYAICLKTDNKAIGAIELKLNGHTDMTERDDECELGYWLGKSFWGQGIVPEAAREMLRHAFEDIGMQKVWCGYYEGNLKSKRVQEKCGFRYQWTTEGVDVPLMHEKRTGHVNLMTKDDWLWRELYEAARSVGCGHPLCVRKDLYRSVCRYLLDPRHLCGAQRYFQHADQRGAGDLQGTGSDVQWEDRRSLRGLSGADGTADADGIQRHRNHAGL